MKITDILVCIIAVLMVYTLFVSSMLLLKSMINEKYHIKIYIRKSNRYLGHKEPIYQLSNEFYTYNITKYVLKYKYNFILNLFTTLFIYPISIYTYGYNIEGEIPLCDEEFIAKKIDELISDNISLGEYYENEIKENRKLIETENINIENENSKINNLNKEFNENYI